MIRDQLAEQRSTSVAHTALIVDSQGGPWSRPAHDVSPPGTDRPPGRPLLATAPAPSDPGARAGNFASAPAPDRPTPVLVVISRAPQAVRVVCPRSMGRQPQLGGRPPCRQQTGGTARDGHLQPVRTRARINAELAGLMNSRDGNRIGGGSGDAWPHRGGTSLTDDDHRPAGALEQRLVADGGPVPARPGGRGEHHAPCGGISQRQLDGAGAQHHSTAVAEVAAIRVGEQQSCPGRQGRERPRIACANDLRESVGPSSARMLDRGLELGR